MSDKYRLKNLSEEFLRKLAGFSAGYLLPDSFEKLQNIFSAEISSKYFTFGSESNMLRIISGMFDKSSFLNNCIRYPHFVEILSAISINSNYLTDILVRDPEYFYLIVNEERLSEKNNEKDFFASTLRSLESFKTLEAKLNFLRSLKRKEILRIGTKDILGLINLKETTEELSILAKVLTRVLFEVCYHEILAKYKFENLQRKCCLVSLGKLGGFELNYSSDVDLLIFYDEDEHLPNNKEYHEILLEAVYLFIESASSITGAGYIYRVDFRLRPDGRNSPLCRSYADYINYYESRGEDWERQMLIKLGFIAGDEELFNRFKNYISPFVYPASFSVSPLEQIKRLKSGIEKNLTDDQNIKLIPGGIRDIEFSVQALQLLNGGRHKEIRTGNTLDAIKMLEEKLLLITEEAEIFKAGYTLFRKIEHYLQLMNDVQTHNIPSEGEMLYKMSTFLGYSDSAAFKEAVIKTRKEVLKIYNSIMGIEDEKSYSAKIPEIIFDNKRRAEKDFQYLREGKGLLGQKEFDKNIIELFRNIESTLFKYLRKSLTPDLVLKNFVRIIKSDNFPSIWYSAFEDEKFFKSFLTICEYSQKSVDLFAEDEELKENFLTRKVFEKINESMTGNWAVKKILFFLSIQHILKLISVSRLSEILSRFFSLKINVLSEEQFKNEPGLEYFIAAMGSFGSGEMLFGSDIDLIFVVKNLDSKPYLQKDFQIFLLNLKEQFKPFDADCRLRPEGKSSLLVWDLESYKNYIKTRARIWELQSFCKINFICGDKKIFNSFLEGINARVGSETKDKIRSEIIEIRKKLYSQRLGILSQQTRILNFKKVPGGLADIDFLLQYLILSSPGMFSKFSGKGISKSISLFMNIEEKLKRITVLKENFIFLKELQAANQNIFNATTSIMPNDEKKNKILARWMGFHSGEELRTEINKVLQSNLSVFEATIKKE
jgi:glutamate-ammonia-ligase adenylyltransferase